MSKVNIGVAHIKIGAIHTDGGMGQVLAKLGDTSEGTCKLNFADGEETKFFVEEHDNPIHIENTQGEITIEFEVPEYDLNTVVKVFGGSVSGTTYKAPIAPVTIEQSLELKFRKGVTFKFPRVSITGKFSSEVGKKNILALQVKATVLNPTKEGEPRFTIESAA